MKHSVIFFSVIFAIVSLSSCGDENKKEEKFLRPVKYQEVNYMGVNRSRTFSGTAEMNKVIDLSFRSAGIISKFEVRLGQKVKKGQLLATLDNVQSRLSYEQALTQMTSAESQLNTTKLNLDRVRDLYEKESTSLSDLENAKNAHKTATQSYESAKRGVGIQQEQVKFGSLYAPETGVISAVNSEVNENIAPGQSVATLNAGTDMQITLGVPESIINKIHEGDTVSIDFSAFPGKTFHGQVSEVSPTLSNNAATYPIQIKILDTTEVIKSGMTANVNFDFRDTKTAKNIIVVPSGAVGEDHEGPFVFRIVQDGENTIVKKQTVKIGELTPEGFEIITGLQVGQKIATAGLQTLLDAQEIQL